MPALKFFLVNIFQILRVKDTCFTLGFKNFRYVSVLVGLLPCCVPEGFVLCYTPTLRELNRTVRCVLHFT